MSIRSTVFSVVVAAFLGAVLGGCGGAASKIQGKVIRGDISFLVIVEANDPRLKGEGLPGARVTISSVSSRGGAVLDEAISDSDGNVSLKVNGTANLLRPAEFTAELDGYARTSSEMSVPPVDKRLLILLKSNAPGAAK